MASAARIDGKTTGEILAEAIQATGGPTSESLVGVKTYVDQHYPGFPWQSRWFTQIEGAKAGLRAKLGIEWEPKAGPLGAEEPQTAEAAEPAEPCGVRRARRFVEAIGEGSLDKAREVLARLLEFGSLEGLDRAIETWSDLLEAVNGDEATAERVLDVLSRSDRGAYPRLASETARREAA